MSDYVTDAVNLFLERLDRMIDALEEIAYALESNVSRGTDEEE